MAGAPDRRLDMNKCKLKAYWYFIKGEIGYFLWKVTK